jgi:hypothetical protein
MANGGSSFMQRHRFGVFYATALAIVLGVMAVGAIFNKFALLGDLLAFLKAKHLYPNVLTIGRFAVQQPWTVLIFLFALAPSLAAIVASLGAGGAAGLKDLFSRFAPWRAPVGRRAALRAYLLLFGCYAAGAAFFLWVALKHADPAGREAVLGVIGGSPLAIISTLLLGIFVDEGGSLEELGWRGFALPTLLDRGRSPLRTTLLLGALWWAWHLPRELPGLLGGTPLGGFVINQGVFLLLCAALSIVITFFWQRTGASVWPAILIHGGANVWSKALGGPMNAWLGTDGRTVVVVIGAALIVLLTGRGLGRPAAQDFGAQKV